MIDPLAADDPPAVVLAAAACGESLMLRTSATSGVSRALRRTAASWVDSFPAVAARLDLRAGDTVWIPGPLAATMNLFAACLAHWAGASWSAHPQRCRFIQTTPTGLRRLVPRTAMSGATVVVAGDRLPARDRDIARAAGLRVQHYYGAAELSLVAWGSCEEDLRLFDDVEADVRDGQLWVRSPWLSSGPVPGEEPGDWRCDADGFATVGDLARLAQDRLTVLGRPGSVTTGGATVAVAPIEDALRRGTGDEVYVVGLAHPHLGEILTAATMSPDARERSRRWAGRHLDGPHRPRRWLLIDRVPLTAAGKPDRSALVEQLESEVNGAQRRLGEPV